MSKKSIALVLFISSLIMASLACRFTRRPDPTATPRPVVEAVEVVIEPTATLTPEPAEEEVQVEEEPKTDAGVGEGITKSMWKQDGSYIHVGFLFENPSSDTVYEDVMFSYSLFDGGGKLLYDDYQIIPWVFPEETVGLFFSPWLDEDADLVADVSIDFSYSSTSSAGDMANPFSTADIVYWPNDGFPLVTGKIVNDDATTLTDILVYAIGYDRSGDIVGGGMTYVDFVLLEDYMGFLMYIDTVGEIDRLDVFPIMTYSTQFIDRTDFDSFISVLDYNFYQDDWGYIEGGYLIINESDATLRNSMIVFTFYNDLDQIVAITTSYVNLLLPGQVLGISPLGGYPPEGAEPTWLDWVLLPGEVYYDYELAMNPFEVISTTVSGDFDQYVQVVFNNTYDKQISDLDVYVLLYNEDGLIIGGGTYWFSRTSIPGVLEEVEVWVSYGDSETIAAIDAWVIPTTWSQFD